MSKLSEISSSLATLNSSSRYFEMLCLMIECLLICQKTNSKFNMSDLKWLNFDVLLDQTIAILKSHKSTEAF